jgi:AcrR family transcriptional regulator
MDEKAEYRSAVRSRENIRTAYVELIHEKGTIEVTVKEVVERADVNRSTFYAHYQDIYAVLEEIENEIVQKLFAFLDASEHTELLYDPLPFLLRIGRELERNRDFYRLLLETNGSVDFTQKLKDVFLERMLTDKKAFSQIRQQREFLVCMNLLAGGGVGLFSDWVTGKIDLPMQELASVVNDIALNAIRQYV